MAGVNKVILVGNLGKDPEIKSIDANTRLAKFSLATTESYKDRSGNKVENTEWHNITLWRGLADIAERFLKKGDTVYIEGKIKTRSYDDNNGEKRYITEIVGENMTMLSKRRSDGQDNSGYQPAQQQQGGGSNSGYQAKPAAPQAGAMDTDFSQGGDDDLPF